MRDVI